MKSAIIFLSLFILSMILSGQSIRVVEPNGGESLRLGDYITIRWRATDVPGDVRIILCQRGPGSTTERYNIIMAVPADRGNHRWEVGSFMGGRVRSGENYFIRIRRTETTEGRDDSDGVFTILPERGTFTLIAPDGGERWEKGSTEIVRWRSERISGNINLYLARYGPTTGYIARDIPNTGSFRWEINRYVNGDPIEPGSSYVFAIEAADGTSCQPSRRAFTILPRPEDSNLQILFPERGSRLELGEDYQIRWNSLGSRAGESVNIYVRRESDGYRRDIVRNHRNRPGENRCNFHVRTPNFMGHLGDYRLHIVSNTRVSSQSEIFQIQESDGIPNARRSDFAMDSAVFRDGRPLNSGVPVGSIGILQTLRVRITWNRSGPYYGHNHRILISSARTGDPVGEGEFSHTDSNDSGIIEKEVVVTIRPEDISRMAAGRAIPLRFQLRLGNPAVDSRRGNNQKTLRMRITNKPKSHDFEVQARRSNVRITRKDKAASDYDRITFKTRVSLRHRTRNAAGGFTKGTVRNVRVTWKVKYFSVWGNRYHDKANKSFTTEIGHEWSSHSLNAHFTYANAETSKKTPNFQPLTMVFEIEVHTPEGIHDPNPGNNKVSFEFRLPD